MVDVFEEVSTSLLAVQEVPTDHVQRYGIVAGRPVGERLIKVDRMVEKPKPEDAPSRMGVAGRYILTPDIFPALEATASDRTGEIQLTNGLRRLLRDRPIYACEINGVRHDTGNKLGFLKAVVYFALHRPELAEPFRRYLESLELKVGVGGG